MASNTSYPDVRSMAFGRSITLHCLSSMNITLFLYCHASLVDLLVAQKQHSASFMFSSSNLLWFALILGVGVISVRLGLANGLDDPVT